ncbi:polyprenyl synthetase family protein [candidate division KSB1 bacterium]
MFSTRKVKEKEGNYELRLIIEPIEDDFCRFKDNFKIFVRSDVELLNFILKYITDQDGKKIRPILLLLSSGLCGDINEINIKSAAIVEILHTASLIHDDIIDHADERRGLPTINNLWKNQLSVLVGDYLFSRVFRKAAELDNLEIMKILSIISIRMTTGEILQIESSEKFIIDEEKYFRIISDKTASLFSACCEISAVIARIGTARRNALKQFGEYLGIAFQVKDDLFEYNGEKKKTGKPKGVDIKNNSITLPLIYSLNNCDKKERQNIISSLKKGVGKEEIKNIISFVKRCGGIEYANEKALYYAELAKSNLSLFDDSPYKKSLLKFVDFAVNREK